MAVHTCIRNKVHNTEVCYSENFNSPVSGFMSLFSEMEVDDIQKKKTMNVRKTRMHQDKHHQDQNHNIKLRRYTQTRQDDTRMAFEVQL